MLLCGDVRVHGISAASVHKLSVSKIFFSHVINSVNINKEMLKYDACMFSEANSQLFSSHHFLYQISWLKLSTDWPINFCWPILPMLTKWLTKHIAVPFIESYLQF